MGRQSKKKVFVDDKDAAIDLARAVANVVEEKTQIKIKTRHEKVSARTHPEHDGRESAKKSKGRLERAKAAVAQQAAHVKREKAKLRRRAKASDGANAQEGTTTVTSGEKPALAENSGLGSQPASKSKSKKRVTFG
ncbi:hypothetical protein GSI_04646 [Ganoderma sinense ZZ0214-1]|uniref:Uncharacterized protein n=1 Tax=Ganoderma sinense ZZ0214-1 TaxID=1077348 RepID=A0A2G8SHF4_9APHY|nr:hypothetical protein GSI_04646 [Ganoderma sinense ZZ0214-1]